jgi:hypothetical protein
MRAARYEIAGMHGMDAAASVPATRRRERQLGKQLRVTFERFVSEAVPHDMARLLDQIDAKQTALAIFTPRRH